MSTKIFKSKTILAGLNAKTVKGDKGDQFVTAIMYLAPAAQSLLGNVCPMARLAGCEAGCLSKAGRAGIFSSIVNSRIAKTQRYFNSRSAFMAELVRDIAAFERWCVKHKVLPAVRLNGTSDIQWETAHPADGFASIFDRFPGVQFYDYTKVYKRAYKALPANYSLTLSYSEASPRYAEAVTKAAKETGRNLAVVFRTKEMRNQFTDRVAQFGEFCSTVIDGDETDMRFTDPKGCIVGLYAKGKGARRDTTGFVIG